LCFLTITIVAHISRSSTRTGKKSAAIITALF
jgi:hypothetical protein